MERSLHEMTLKPVPKERLHRLFYPQVPAVIAVKLEDIVNAMPATSIMHVSSDPPTIATSIMTRLYTWELLKKARYFSVNWLDYKYTSSIDILGFTPGRGVKDKLRKAGLTWEPGVICKNVPVIKEAVATLECKMVKHIEIGDHNLVIADVLNIQAISDFQEYWSYKEYKPILYLGATPNGKRGRYVTITKT